MFLRVVIAARHWSMLGGITSVQASSMHTDKKLVSIVVAFSMPFELRMHLLRSLKKYTM